MNRKIVYWVDDARNPSWKFSEDEMLAKDVVWIKDYDTFAWYLYNMGAPDEIYFDHDLGDEKSGLDCAKLLVQYCEDYKERLPKHYSCHSSNPAGHDNIMSYLDSYRKSKEDEY